MRCFLVLLSGMVALAGCGQTCQSTCQHVYDPSECGITHAGFGPDDLIDTCVSDCLTALSRPGEMGTYNPMIHQLSRAFQGSLSVIKSVNRARKATTSSGM